MVDYTSGAPTEDSITAEYAVKGRGHLKMQWPALMTLGLVGVLFPILSRYTAPVEAQAILVEHLTIKFVGTLLLLHGLMILWFTVHYGMKPGFSWRAGMTIFTLFVASGVLIDPLDLHIPIAVSVASYIIATAIYLIVEGKTVFVGESSRPLFINAGISILLGFSLIPDLPMPEFWRPPFVLGLYFVLLALGLRSVSSDA
ncbi:MAG: hypothetical protein CMF31_01480 [Kordiimonas sp.]|nr:hypothetical protein [Kordiimonas sp.]